jgi:hypothetical protein
MKPTSLVRRLSMIGVAALLAVRAASAADVQVMISSGFYGGMLSWVRLSSARAVTIWSRPAVHRWGTHRKRSPRASRGARPPMS